MGDRLHYLLNVLLVIGFVYWFVLVMILVYFSLLLQSTGSDHWCVYIVCTLVLLIVFGAVLILGLLVIYYLRQESSHGALLEYWHSTPLSTCHMDFQKLVDLNTLIPLLCKNRVLGCDDLRSLHKLYQESRTVQLGELVAILETKGKEGIHKLIESLNEDEEHIGHWELSRILADKYMLEMGRFSHKGRTHNSSQWP